MIQEWLDSYQPTTRNETEQALRELMQSVALAGLHRGKFFEQAAFYGGTALRIFHGLDRFSEDLDFTLMTEQSDFDLAPYMDAVQHEFDSLGLTVAVQIKAKSKRSKVDSAFLKSDTLLGEILLQRDIQHSLTGSLPSIKIKIEVDKEPPTDLLTEQMLLLRPYSLYIRCLTKPHLFAGKVHALLFRDWGSRVKGRDWYDLEWFVQRNVKLQTQQVGHRALKSGDWDSSSMSMDEIRYLLLRKADTLAMDRVIEDVIRFVKDPSRFRIWSADYFKQLLHKIQPVE